MSYSKILTAVVVLAAVAAAAPSAAFADRRDGGRHRGNAVPRGSVHGIRPPGRAAVVPYRAYPYRAYRPGFNLGFFYGRPGYYGSYGYGHPFYGYGYPAYVNPFAYPAYGYGYGYAPYGYGYGHGYAPYGYGYGGYSGQPYGGIRIDLPQREGEVYVDGYFAGTVDDFDGAFQQANLEAGPHRIEVRALGYEPIAFDVRIEPGRTITYRASMRPLP